MLPLQNMRKGEFSRTKVSGKTAIELGAGMGLGGLALAMLGGYCQAPCQQHCAAATGRSRYRYSY
jgi:hypothetical protein